MAKFPEEIILAMFQKQLSRLTVQRTSRHKSQVEANPLANSFTRETGLQNKQQHIPWRIGIRRYRHIRAKPTQRALLLPTNETRIYLFVSHSTVFVLPLLFSSATLLPAMGILNKEHLRQSHAPEANARNANETESISLSTGNYGAYALQT